MSKNDLKIAMGDIPSGLFIVTTKTEDNKNMGFVASWVQQASFDPPLITLCLKPERPGAEEIIRKKPFSLNVVAEGKNDFVSSFLNNKKDIEETLKEIDFVDEEEFGITIQNARSVMKCQPIQSTSPGDHTIVVAEVIESTVLDDSKNPEVRTRKTGAHY